MEEVEEPKHPWVAEYEHEQSRPFESKRKDGRGHRRKSLNALIAEKEGVSVRAIQRRMQRFMAKSREPNPFDIPAGSTTTLFIGQIEFLTQNPEMLRKLATFLQYGDKRAMVEKLYRLADEIDPNGSWRL
ncbi:hypothetical protein NKI09_07955 [Mesorhizobium sp. M0757]|uniref:hypothetical protein n=1 Tax=Mesorhizobium sp. M0757 TaxID=2956993 RepID=UPI003338433E